MISEFVNKIIDGFNFTVKDFLLLIIIIVILTGGYKSYNIIENTNIKITNMEIRNYEDKKENAFAVLATLQHEGLTEPQEIFDFLIKKPAGRSDLKKGVRDENIYNELVNVYGELAKNCKKSLVI